MKKVYTIEGLDCPNCALKIESGLRKDSNVLSASIDFTSKRLYITYREKEYSFNEINSIIKRLDSSAYLVQNVEIKKSPIINKKIIILLCRVAISTILMIIAILGEFAFAWPLQAYLPIYIAALIIVLYDITWKAIQNIIHLRNPFDENLLLTIASIGAFCLKFLGDSAFFEGVLVIILSQVGEIFESIANNKSRNAIINAVDMRADEANLLIDNQIKVVKSTDLNVGDHILIKVGETVPADGKIISGTGLFDTSSLTGEFVPIESKIGNDVLSGYILTSGSITLSVSKLSKDSAASKVLELVTSSGERKAKADKFISKFAKIYTPIVFSIAILFAVIPSLIFQSLGTTPVVGENPWSVFLYRALCFLVVACPCAIVISVPLAFFSGIGLASKNGIVVKGANYFDKLCDIKTIVTDKTGTLTYGSFKISKTIINEGIDDADFYEDLLAAESLSNHPIAKAIIGGDDISKIATDVTNYNEIAGLGVTCIYHGNTLVAGNADLLQKEGVSVANNVEIGTIIYLAKNGVFLGYVVLGDEIKKGSFDFVNKLHKNGIKICMLTGDNEQSAKATAKELNIDNYYSHLLPEQKIDVLEGIMSKTKKGVAFVGDGINDAPSIIRSDVGIAMGGLGSDLAVDNADIVIMNDNPQKIVEAIEIADATRNKAIFNIVVALIIKISLMVLSAFGLVPMWLAVLADTGLTVLLIINSILLLYKKIK